jgi:uncharacterized membrane protein YcaP (DUF421 family)
MIFFDNFYGLFRIVVVAVIFYISFIVFLRISGKRSTSQMNNFDWLITVTLASMLGSTILIDEVVVLEGLIGAGALVALNLVLTKVSFYSRESRIVLYDKPSLLFYNGEFLIKEMERERVTEDEIMAAIRGCGFGSLYEVGAVVLETNASLSVLPMVRDEDNGVLGLMSDVRGFPEAAAASRVRASE